MAATDRTKTPEEIAKDEAKRLHELETRRLARMSGDFEKDDFSDISDDEGDSGAKRKKRGKKASKKSGATSARNPDELDSDEEEDSNELEAKFTADGLVYVDKEGNIVKKAGEESDNEDQDMNNDEDTPDGSSEEEDSDDLGASDDDASVDSGDGLSSGEESDIEGKVLEVGTKIKGKYLAHQQFEEKGKWYKGTIKAATEDDSGNTVYDVEYDDGDIEKGVSSENVRCQKETNEAQQEEEEKRVKLAKISKQRQKAKQKAR